MRKYGLVITPAGDKSSANVDAPIAPADATFLKRRFVQVDGVTLAPLALQSIISSVCTVRRGPQERETYLDRVRSAMLEAAVHDSVTYYKIGELVMSGCVDMNIQFSYAIGQYGIQPYVEARARVMRSASLPAGQVDSWTNL